MKTYLIIILFSFMSLYARDLSHWQSPNNIPFPKDNPITKEKVDLGRLLFFDKRVSSSDTISCATCHDPKFGWSDGLKKSIGVEKREGRRNSPTIINSAYLSSFFHDGRASSLEDQAKGPIETDVEMDMSMKKLVKKLKSIKGYRKLFANAFGDEGICEDTILKAIASFERTIISLDAPFDRWIKGDEDAISLVAKEGFEIFLDKGRCASCHDSFKFTNESFNNVGLGDMDDLGVYEISKNKSNIWRGAFKTPTLRDIVKTAPYFHDGSVKSLKQAVKFCGNGGREGAKLRSPFFRDRKLDKDDVEKIVEFLKTLSSNDAKIQIPLTFPK